MQLHWLGILLAAAALGGATAQTTVAGTSGGVGCRVAVGAQVYGYGKCLQYTLAGFTTYLAYDVGTGSGGQRLLNGALVVRAMGAQQWVGIGISTAGACKMISSHTILAQQGSTTSVGCVALSACGISSASSSLQTPNRVAHPTPIHFTNHPPICAAPTPSATTHSAPSPRSPTSSTTPPWLPPPPLTEAPWPRRSASSSRARP